MPSDDYILLITSFNFTKLSSYDTEAPTGSNAESEPKIWYAEGGEGFLIWSKFLKQVP